MNTELTRFARAVARMRDRQRAYDRDQTAARGREAKAAAQHVDECLRWIAAAAESIDAAEIPPVRAANQKDLIEDQEG